MSNIEELIDKALDSRFKILAYEYKLSASEIKNIYNGRLYMIKHCYSSMYIGRESRMQIKAYKGTLMALQAKYKDKVLT